MEIYISYTSRITAFKFVDDVPVTKLMSYVNDHHSQMTIPGVTFEFIPYSWRYF